MSARFGTELRIARAAAGLSQARLARLAGVSQQEVSRAERGDPAISLEVRCRLAAACGHELGLGLWPKRGVSLRDSGQLEIAQVIVRAASSAWEPRLEMPVAPGDLRAADLVLYAPVEVIHIEIERTLVDFQAQSRAAQLKRDLLADRAGRPVRLVIALTDTRNARRRLLGVDEVIRRTFPASSAQIWRGIRNGTPIGRDGILYVRPDRAIPPRLTRTRSTRTAARA